MKNWLSKIFGGQKKPGTPVPASEPPLGITVTQDEQVSPSSDRSIEMTLAASPPNDPQGLHAAEAQVALEWKVGDVILDLYEVKHIHEGGGMGLVYRVHHKGWNTDLAVKSPRAEYFQTQIQKENFIRECETWINLGLHPYIVSCHYVRTLGGIPRVFAEYVEGGSLKDWIDSRRLYEGGPQAALKRILDIAIQMAWGLHYAHEREQGVIHQDVKPANVLMLRDGTAKISDFGLARARAAVGQSVMAGAGHSILVSSGGMTPAYCSPEQADKEPLSRKTDIWSWAVSVLEMFVGEVCWRSGTAAPEVLKQLSEMRVDGVGLPELPAGLRELLQACFESDPARRPKDASEISRRLAGIYRSQLNQDYARPEPAEAEARADSLNNREVSLLDLGKGEEAENLWTEALQSETHHLEATYSLGLARWRTGRITFEALLRDLRESEKTAGDVARVAVLRAQVLLECDDCEGAVVALETLEGADSERQDVRATLLDANRRMPTSRRCLRTFVGHTDGVYSVCLSADGELALSGSHDKTLKMWQVATGKCLPALEGHTDLVESVCLSTDVRFALSGSRDKTLKLWKWSSGWQCLRTFEGHTNGVLSVCLGADGRFALSGSFDQTLKLWEVATGRCLRTFEGHRGGVYSVCLSADARVAVSGGWDYTLKLWEMATGRCLRSFDGHTGYVYSVCLSADARFALSGSADKTLKLWEVATGRCLRTFEGHTADVNSLCVSADGLLALSGSGDKTLKLWDVATGRCLRTFEGHARMVTSVCLSADSRSALSGSQDRTVKLWEVAGNADSLPAPAELSRLVTSAAAASASAICRQHLEAGREALSRGDAVSALRAFRVARRQPGFQRDRRVLDEQARLYPLLRHSGLAGGWEDGTLEGHTGQVNSLCVSADGRLALSGSGDKTLKLWDVATGRCLRTFEGHSGGLMGVLSATFSPDGRWALSGGDDKTLKLWDVATGRCLRTFEGQAKVVWSICLSADGRLALSGSGDKTLKLWEVATGRCLRTFEGHTEGVGSVCLSADGRFALSGSWDNTLKLWEVATGQCRRTFEGHGSMVHSVCLSTDGRFALSGSEDRTLKLWEVATGQCRRTFEGHTDRANSTCLSADGRFALSGSADKTLKVWEVGTGRCRRTFEGHKGSVKSVCLSADGRLALSGGQDNTPKLWFLDWELEENQPSDWDEGARAHLANFLSAHTPYAGRLPEGREPTDEEITRLGLPVWSEEDFQRQLYSLGCAGFGWLRPEGVKRELEKMVAEWQGPPPLPWEQVS